LDPRWKSVISAEGEHPYRFLALNLLLSRIKLSLARGGSPEDVARGVEEVRGLLERNAHLASVQQDLARIFGGEEQTHALMTVEEAAAAIGSGRALLLAGHESLLSRLPPGDWIGGTTTYFMAPRGGVHTREQLFVTEVPRFAERVVIQTYGGATLARVYADIPCSGYGVMIVPLFSQIQLDFALGAPASPGFASRPLVGWVSGADEADAGKVSPKVFDGRSGRALENEAVVMHVSLPSSKAVEVGTVNIFAQGGGDALVFPESGWAPREVIVNGTRRGFASYLEGSGLDLRRPLVGSYGGAKLNVGIRALDRARGAVSLWAPVFSGITYRHAASVDDIAGRLSRAPSGLADGRSALAFSCNCYSNYVHGLLEGKHTGPFVGPIGFGEIAYQVCNETLVFLTVGGS
jgi:hypothetical protein